ncbi:MAG: protease inhibitor I42 family protein [Acidobacteriota bacterium]
MPQVDETSNGKEIELPIGETLELILEENRTTGFKWTLESKGEGVCKLASDDFEPGAKVGQPGKHRWVFRADRAGSDSIKLSSGRSWDKQGKAERTFTLSIRVPE